MPLLDPMCGSGTLLIEGAWMAADVAPGLLREYFGFLGWRQFDPARLAGAAPGGRGAARCGHCRHFLSPFGYDLEQRAIGHGPRQRQKSRPGWSHRPRTARRQTRSSLHPAAPRRRRVLVVTNPPYGKRLGDVEALIPTYETLGRAAQAIVLGLAGGRIHRQS